MGYAFVGYSKDGQPFQMKLVTSGHSRLVLLLGRWAIKFPRVTSWSGFLRGLLGNLTERSWRYWPGVCPIVWAAPLGLMLVCQRARELTDEEWEAGVYKEVALSLGVAYIEDKRDSFGVLESGEVVVVDYGGWE